MVKTKNKPRFIIVCEDENGNVFNARTWEGASCDGIAAVRAAAAAGEFIYKVTDVWAVPTRSR